MMKMKKVNSSVKTVFLILFCTALFLFLLNLASLKIADDYSYCFSFQNKKERITALNQMIPSMQAHYQNVNGRLLTHAAVQIVLAFFPDWLFDLVNALFFVLLLVMIYRLGWKGFHKEHNAAFLLGAAGALWVFIPTFGQSILWLDGSVNYLWPVALICLYITPVMDGGLEKMKKPLYLAYLLAGILIGALSETASAFAIGFFFLAFLYEWRIGKKNFPLRLILPVLFMLPLYLKMIASPGTKKNKGIGFDGIALRFTSAYSKYTGYFLFLLIAWILGMILALSLHLYRREMIFSVIFAVLSFCTCMMYSFAGKTPDRGLLVMAVALIIADTLLLGLLWESVHHLLCVMALSLVIFFAAVRLVPGLYDIYITWRDMRANEQILLSEQGNESASVTLTNIYPETPYSCAYGLDYLNLKKSSAWPNKYMRAYYGVGEVIGVK